MYVIINGYGVPKDINADLNYNSYLGQVFNYLWDRYRGRKLTLILCGGNTDMIPPYRKTEAGEMAQWFRPRLRALGFSKRWKLKLCSISLSAVENLLASRRIVDMKRALYFCEKTHQQKAERLAHEIFGRRVRVVPIDFNTSPPRYDHATHSASDREDLRYSLRALKDPLWRRRLNEANKKKIRVLRKISPARRRIEVERIARMIRREYMTSK